MKKALVQNISISVEKKTNIRFVQIKPVPFIIRERGFIQFAR